MPLLTEEKKAQIVIKLGYPFTSVDLFDILQTDLPPYVIEKINFFLAEIDTVTSSTTSSSTSILTGLENLKIKKIDDIEFFETKTDQVITPTITINSDEVVLINKLSELLSIPKAYSRSN